MPGIIERLNIFSRAGAICAADSLINLVGRLSWPSELVFFRVLMTLKISATDVVNRYIE